MRLFAFIALLTVGCTAAPFGAIGAPCAADGDCDQATVCRPLDGREGSFCLPAGDVAPDAGELDDAGQPDAGEPEPDAGPVPCVGGECAAGTFCTEVVGAGTQCLAPSPSELRIVRGGLFVIPGVRGEVPGTGVVILHPRLGSLPVITGCAPGTPICIHAGELR